MDEWNSFTTNFQSINDVNRLSIIRPQAGRQVCTSTQTVERVSVEQRMHQFINAENPEMASYQIRGLPKMVGFLLAPSSQTGKGAGSKKSSLGRVPAFRAPKSGRWKFRLGNWDWRLLKLVATSWTPVGSLQTPTASCRLMLQAHGRSHMQKLKGHQPETFCGRPTGSD